ncbi:CocE/NonD family hydrolase [Nocardia barduliensis]|uniref:CocE/NonD family hydrolase n=1 Tax=Nocardia barduliensis TaxID=2736643 RepID=UPI001574B4CC|nr:CocE/NonD family hydrolase [Nocardia barduliensis]
MRRPSAASLLLQRMLKLPPPITRDLVVERDLQVPMRDGAILLADRWAPRSDGQGLPTVLVRGPYGRGGPIAAQLVRPLAERGFQVVMQSARGTGGSSGSFFPMRHERLDGLDTVEWVCKQPWFGDSIVLYGPSYLGYTQWAMADHLPAQVKAMIPAVTESALSLEFLRRDAFNLEAAFGWGALVDMQKRPWATPRFLMGARRRRRAELTLPLSDADQVALGHRSEIIQDFLTHDSESTYWAGARHDDKVAQVEVPVSMITGWFDVFLQGQLRDYITLKQAARQPRLTVGPWSHTSPELNSVLVHEALDFGLAHAHGADPSDRAPVRVYVMGAEQWRDLTTWPPPGYAPRRYHLQPAGRLAAEPPPQSHPDSYRYDPADPTPAAGGNRLLPGIEAGRVDNTALEARPDVLTYTSDVLDDDLEIIGDVCAQIWFRSSRRHTDVFVRVCEVDPTGRSTNICDGLSGLTGADELACVTVALTSTAYLFKRGHRIRVQVSSGAFPLYNRNPGTGEPRLTATTLQSASQHIHHDPDHPSAVLLPVRTR